MTADLQAKVEREYPPMMRRADVFEVGKRLGLSVTTVRRLIDGREAVIRARRIGGQTRGYYDRGRVIEVLFDLT